MMSKKHKVQPGGLSQSVLSKYFFKAPSTEKKEEPNVDENPPPVKPTIAPTKLSGTGKSAVVTTEGKKEEVAEAIPNAKSRGAAKEGKTGRPVRRAATKQKSYSEGSADSGDDAPCDVTEEAKVVEVGSKRGSRDTRPRRAQKTRRIADGSDEDFNEDDHMDIDDEPEESSKKTAAKSKGEAKDGKVAACRKVSEKHREGPADKPARVVQQNEGKLEGKNKDVPIFTQDPDVHKKFVNRIGTLDLSIHAPTGPVVVGDEGDEHGEEAPASGGAAAAMDAFANKSGKAAKKSAVKYTPLEEQFMEIKKNHSDAVLFVECGYKYRFFGDDARIAAQVLNIFAHVDKNFLTASIPTHRLAVHTRRLVEAGYKVGVVSQTETAARKKTGDNKGGPFTRELTAMYTKATMIAEEDKELMHSGAATVFAGTGGSTGVTYLMCLHEEERKGTALGSAHVSYVAVDPSTGDVVYEVFEDDHMRSQLETRLRHLAPAEIILKQSAMSSQTEKLVKILSSVVKENGIEINEGTRIERLDDSLFEATYGKTKVADFYCDSLCKDKAGKLESIMSLDDEVKIPLGVMIHYLEEFKLDRVFQSTMSFRHFSSSLRMTLNATTLSNLDILTNSSTGNEKGSLLWLLNTTSTPFGARLLRKWTCHPLLDRQQIEERQDAVEEILRGDCVWAQQMADNLRRIQVDIERGICRIYYKKCGPKEFWNILDTFKRASKTLVVVAEEQCPKSKLLCQLVDSVPEDLEAKIDRFLNSISKESAMKGNKTEMFGKSVYSQFPRVGELRQGILDCKKELRLHLEDIRKVLNLKGFEYSTVSGIEYLVEVKVTHKTKIPSSWVKVGGTKSVDRYHTPLIEEKILEMAAMNEELAEECEKAWYSFLGDFAEDYEMYRSTVKAIGTFDCLNALANAARRDGYVRPKFTDERCLRIEDGRHPMIEAMIADNYVPNSIEMGNSCGLDGLVITGPNMGGKSCFMRQTALITIMAQIGSFVPADSVEMSVVDGVYTRMGANDDITRGLSTFLVELQEASDILKSSTERSLVLLDELGRGTSTHDGTAIAIATLQHLVQNVKAFTLFATHYPMVGELEKQNPTSIHNYHMAFFQEGGDSHDVTFLYKLTRGLAHRSFGLNVAKLAGLDPCIVEVAAAKSAEMESQAQLKKVQVLAHSALSTILKLSGHTANSEEARKCLDRLGFLHKNILGDL